MAPLIMPPKAIRNDSLQVRVLLSRPAHNLIRATGMKTERNLAITIEIVTDKINEG